jgi:hypothetical protein
MLFLHKVTDFGICNRSVLILADRDTLGCDFDMDLKFRFDFDFDYDLIFTFTLILKST